MACSNLQDKLSRTKFDESFWLFGNAGNDPRLQLFKFVSNRAFTVKCFKTVLADMTCVEVACTDHLAKAHKFIQKWYLDSTQLPSQVTVIDGQEIEQLCKEIHTHFKLTLQKLMATLDNNTVLLVFASCWPMDLVDDYIDLKIYWTNITFRKIPIKFHNIVYWWSFMIGFLDSVAFLQYGTPGWFKYWVYWFIKSDICRQIVFHMRYRVMKVLQSMKE